MRQILKVKVKVKSLSPVGLVVTPWTAAYQAPLSMVTRSLLVGTKHEKWEDRKT